MTGITFSINDPTEEYWYEERNYSVEVRATTGSEGYTNQKTWTFTRNVKN